MNLMALSLLCMRLPLSIRRLAVTGNVFIGANVYIGPSAAIRGDWGKIVIDDGCNVQENCTIHMFPGVEVRLKRGSACRSWGDCAWRNAR